MVGGFKRQRHAAFVAYGKRFQWGYGKLQYYDAIGKDTSVIAASSYGDI